MNDHLFDISAIPWGQLAQLEQRVRSSETTGIRARWEFGCWLRDEIPPEVGGRGKVSPLQTIAAELGVSVTELKYRRIFATQYPTEAKVVNALTTFGSWHEVIAHGLVREGKEPVEPPPLPDGEWRTIVADPPWKVTAGPGWPDFTDSTTQPLEYPTLTAEQVAALEIKERAADDAHLYLWTINRYVPDAYDIARAWGFKPSTLLVWAKAPHGWGLGGTFGLTTEYILFARRGDLAAKQHVDRSWFDWPRGRHSEKPGGFFDLVAGVSPGPYLELFGRQPREGWVVWGDEVAA